MLGEVWTAPVTTGASMALTWSNTGTGGVSDQDHSLWVGYVTGHDPATPIGASVEGLFALDATSISETLSASPVSSSMVVAGLSVSSEGQTGVTPGSGWTELYDGAPDWYAAEEIMYRGGSTSASVNWSAV